MARLAMFGAETGHHHAEGVATVSGTMSYDTTIVRSGTRSFKSDSLAGAASRVSYAFTGVTERTYIATAWIYIPSATGFITGNISILSFNDTAAAASGQILLISTGRLRLVRGGTTVGSDSAILAVDTWYRIDLLCKIGVGAVDLFEGRLNGTVFATSGAVSHSDVLLGALRFGWGSSPGASEILYLDDITLNDDTGSVNNTYPGDEKVVLLLPTADSARDAGWLAGGGASTNLWDAVDNIPPAGVSGLSSTNTSQIKNAVSTTTEAYSATMRTYTAAGLASGDTVTAVQAVAVIGTSSGTVVPTGIQITSNPAITEVVASPPSTAAGTYPTNWARGATATVENPTVTMGTAPVMRVRKNLASIVNSQVCFMGMYVSYTVGAPPTGTRRRFVLMAVLVVALGLACLAMILGRSDEWRR